ncbi:hypothetical protein [Legionella jordanis]|nr:hypothetical protein [Legionella jordanis]
MMIVAVVINAFLQHVAIDALKKLPISSQYNLEIKLQPYNTNDNKYSRKTFVTFVFASYYYEAN